MNVSQLPPSGIWQLSDHCLFLSFNFHLQAFDNFQTSCFSQFPPSNCCELSDMCNFLLPSSNLLTLLRSAVCVSLCVSNCALLHGLKMRKFLFATSTHTHNLNSSWHGTVCYVTTSFVTRNYNSVLWKNLLCYKKLQQCVMSLPPLLQETITVLCHYLLCYKKL